MPVRRFSPALIACLCLASLWKPAPPKYAPDWKVGDWWVTRVWQQFANASFLWHLERYQVADTVAVDSQACFLLRVRLQSSKGHLTQVGNDFYVRRSDRRVVRRVNIHVNNQRLLSADTTNYPVGAFGPFEQELRLPRFPLQFSRGTDTMFRLQPHNDGFAPMREISQVADPTTVKRLLDDGDTTGRRVVRPTGAVYEVRSEMSGADSVPGLKRLTRSLQLWTKERPWRVYEELARYDGADSTRYVAERTWLVESGRADQ